MPEKKSSNSFRYLLPAIYLFGLGASNVSFTILNGRQPHWVDYTFLIISAVPLLLRKKYAWIIVGYIMAVTWGYLILAVTSDLIDFLNGSKPLKHPWKNFGVGYSLTVISFLMGVGMIIAGKRLRNRDRKTKEILPVE
jgi:hypothetical protein